MSFSSFSLNLKQEKMDTPIQQSLVVKFLIRNIIKDGKDCMSIVCRYMQVRGIKIMNPLQKYDETIIGIFNEVIKHSKYSETDNDADIIIVISNIDMPWKVIMQCNVPTLGPIATEVFQGKDVNNLIKNILNGAAEVIPLEEEERPIERYSMTIKDWLDHIDEMKKHQKYLEGIICKMIVTKKCPDIPCIVPNCYEKNLHANFILLEDIKNACKDLTAKVIDMQTKINMKTQKTQDKIKQLKKKKPIEK